MESLDEWRAKSLDLFAELSILEKKRMDLSQTLFLLELQIETNILKREKFSIHQSRNKVNEIKAPTKLQEFKRFEIQNDLNSAKNNLSSILLLIDQKLKNYMSTDNKKNDIKLPTPQIRDVGKKKFNEEDLASNLANYSQILKRIALLEHKIKQDDEKILHLKNMEKSMLDMAQIIIDNNENLNISDVQTLYDEKFQINNFSFYHDEFSIKC